MGPFELCDLVGIDVGFEVSKSFWEQSFHEPRWRPSMIQARMVQAGRLGRKAGRGYYDYARRAARVPPAGPRASGGRRQRASSRSRATAGSPRTCATLAERGRLRRARPRRAQRRRRPHLLVDASRRALAARGGRRRRRGASGARAASCASTAAWPSWTCGGGAVGFHALPPLDESQLVELTRSSRDDATAIAGRAEAFFRSLGKHVEWVGDAPGLVLGRIVCQLVNEAGFAVAEGVGSPEDVDTAMRTGYNYPRGPLEWADAIELDQVLATLDALYEELSRGALPGLRRCCAGWSPRGARPAPTGEGFFRYDEYRRARATAAGGSGRCPARSEPAVRGVTRRAPRSRRARS